MTKNPKVQLNGRLKPDVYAEYHQIADAEEPSGPGRDNRVLHKLLEHYQHRNDPVHVTMQDVLKSFTWTAEEYQEITNFMDSDHLQTDPWKMLQRGFLREVRMQQHSVPLSDERQRSTVPGAAMPRIHGYVQRFMQANHAARDASELIYITAGLVQDAIKQDGPGQNPRYIAAYFREHAEEVDAHHKAMGFRSRQEGLLHNRKYHPRAKENGSEVAVNT